MYNNVKKEEDKLDVMRDLLEEYLNKDVERKVPFSMIELSKQQEKAMKKFKEGENVLIIGEGGTGKSKLIKELVYQKGKLFKNKRMYVTATTGIAAYNINGITVHSFLGIGTGSDKIDVLVRRVCRKMGVVQRIRDTDILVIDEISMLSAELFEKINVLLQRIRRKNTFFGGIQVVLSGDFLQLLPVFRKNQPDDVLDTRLIIESEVFLKAFTKDQGNIVVLTENYRQTDVKFTEILQRLRMGEQTKEDTLVLKSRVGLECETAAVTLVSSNKKAQDINIGNLKRLKGEAKVFKAEFKGDFTNEITKALKKDLEDQFTQKGILEVTLKVGARVMLVKNLDVEGGLVNGSVGVVQHFRKNKGTNEYLPVVKFDNGTLLEIVPVEFKLEMDIHSVSAYQIPLMLCWAITVHKSQSLTMDAAVMELGDAFCEHMIYVALSRVRSLEGVYLKTFDESKIKVNGKMKDYVGV